MYGLIIDAVAFAVEVLYSTEVWSDVIKQTSLKSANIKVKKVYSESLIPRILKVLVEISGKPADEILELAGAKFREAMEKYGYDRLLAVVGRTLSSFMNCLDNLHNYLRMNYPRMIPPSFMVENESATGLQLTYRSKRKAMCFYVIGMIKDISKNIYDQECQVEILSRDEASALTEVVYKIEFDNSTFKAKGEAKEEDLKLPVDYALVSDVFPYHIVFRHDMMIQGIGSGLSQLLPNTIGSAVDDVFTLIRPELEFSFETIEQFINNQFELLSTQNIRRSIDPRSGQVSNTLDDIMDWQGEESMSLRRLKLKGQMVIMEEWDAVLFLATPIMDNLQMMFDMGVFINDLSLHDNSRELVLAGTQQQTEIKAALDEEKGRAENLKSSLAAVDEEMQRTDALLHQMIPKAIAERLRAGEPAKNMCQLYEKVTILFTDVVGFTNICSRLTPMGVVTMLNDMYSKFDLLVARHRTYKVETIGDAYMCVSGAPMVTKFHAIYISNMAFDMVQAMAGMQDPSRAVGNFMHIRLGIHTGSVVGGCVGIKMPRYCLVGINVTIANKMEESGVAMKIHISETTRKELEGHPFEVEIDKPVTLKLTGTEIRTFWLVKQLGGSSIKGGAMQDL